jgi:hypothetical protein
MDSLFAQAGRAVRRPGRWHEVKLISEETRRRMSIAQKRRCNTPEFRRQKSEAYEWANLTGDYQNPADYRRLCVPCHRKFDNRTRGTKPGKATINERAIALRGRGQFGFGD